jgi:tRNA splicing endonuclease
MPSANVTNLVNIATDLIKKRLALRESAPSIFETLQNIDDQFRIAANAVIASGEEGELTSDELFLINSAISGVPRNRLIVLETRYAPDDKDVVDELRDIKSVNFHELRKLEESNKELYGTLVDRGIIIPEGKK